VPARHRGQDEGDAGPAEVGGAADVEAPARRLGRPPGDVEAQPRRSRPGDAPAGVDTADWETGSSLGLPRATLAVQHVQDGEVC
jgi:hypothetical protein